MFPDLIAPLGWSDKTPPLGRSVLVTDTPGADGSFLLNHFVGLHLRSGHTVCMVGLAQSKLHYSMIAKKLGHPVDDHFVYLDCMTRLLSGDREPARGRGDGAAAQAAFSLADGLPTLVQMVEEASRVGGKPRCVIIDDLGLLTDLGVSCAEVLRFVADCRARVTADGRGCLVVLAHGLATDPAPPDPAAAAGDPADELPPEEDDHSLPRHLRFSADVTLCASGLKSGYSRDVHGQLAIEEVKAGAALPTTAVVQYKMRDNAVAFFAPGTSSAVL
mmetsp:Transcript_1070/g.3090  ORF Transcript_1070/g.3090 Transcript_1070/m.3090 type:complete len:274 (+) Transcript_1070:81-902(+)